MEPRPTEHVERVQARHTAAAKEAETAASDWDPRDRTYLPGSARAPSHGVRSQLQSRQQRVGSPRTMLMNRNKPPPPPPMKFVHHKDSQQYVEDYVRHVSQGIMRASSARSPFEPQPLFSAKQVTSTPSPQGADAYYAQFHSSLSHQEDVEPVPHDQRQQEYQQHREQFHRLAQQHQQHQEESQEPRMWEYKPPQTAASSSPHILWQ